MADRSGFGERAPAKGAGDARGGYYVAAIKPFWRWAVALEDRPDLPGIPYYRKAAALAFYDESRAELPWARTVLLRRRNFGRVELADCSANGVSAPRSGASRKDSRAG